MTEEISRTPNYTMGYSEEFRQLLDRRSAETHTRYLTPHLIPGHRVLDFGCGPGTISVGLAKAVEPGDLHGIDVEWSQVSLARAAAEAGRHRNMAFHVGDVSNLPFEDDFFDLAHCHAVLMHVPDTAASLSEVKRVLKPGGIVGARELFVGSSFLEPGGEAFKGAWTAFARLLEANGGHPQMGRELKSAFVDAGFSDLRTGVSFDFFGSAKDVAFLRAFIDEWFYSSEVIEAATKYGLATREEFDEWREGLDAWQSDPCACGAFAFGEVLASKPMP